MTTDEAREVLHRCAALRFPRLKDFPRGRERVEAIEDYLIETAIARSELEEARLHIHEATDRLQDEWDDIEGWEVNLPPRKGDRTQYDITQAKRVLRPDLYTGIQAGKRLIARTTEQIERLELDDKAASRSYTIVTGS